MKKYLSKYLFTHLPTFLLEQFDYYNNSYHSIMPDNPKLIFNTNKLVVEHTSYFLHRKYEI